MFEELIRITALPSANRNLEGQRSNPKGEIRKDFDDFRGFGIQVQLEIFHGRCSRVVLRQMFG